MKSRYLRIPLFIMLVAVIFTFLQISCTKYYLNPSSVVEGTVMTSEPSNMRSYYPPNTTDFTETIEIEESLIGNTSGNIANGGVTLIIDDFDINEFVKSMEISSNGDYYKLKGNTLEFQFSLGLGYINKYDNWIYYLGESSILHKMNIYGNENFNFNIRCSRINVTKNWIYYIDFEDNYIYRIKHDGSNKEKVIDNICCFEFIVYKGIIYYTDGNEDFNLFRYDIESKKKELLIPDSCFQLNIVNDVLYYVADGIYKIDLNDMNKRIVKIFDYDVISLNIYNNYAYFSSDNGKENGLFKMDLDTRKISFLAESRYYIDWINVIGDYIVFTDVYAEGSEDFVIRNDGTNLTSLDFLQMQTYN